MANDNTTPEGLDEFIAQAADPLDPQSAAGAPALGNALGYLGQQAGKNLDAYGAMLKAAMAGDQQAQMALANHNLGMATMGSLGVPEGAVANDIKQGGHLVDAAGATTPTLAGKPQFGKVTVKNIPKQALGKVIVKESGGGSVPAMMADGGEIVPAGLDQFVAQDDDMSTNGTPHGLDEFIAPEVNQQKYGSPTEMIKTGLEGAAQGILGPIAPAIEKHVFGTKDEDIQGRKEANPFIHGAGEIAGLGGSMLTGFGEGAMAAKLGEAVGAATKAPGLIARLASPAAKAAVENMAIQAGDEVSNMIINDPNTSAQTALADIGLSGILGGTIGGAIGAVSPLFKAAGNTRVAQMIEDFKGRIDERLHTPDPVQATSDELSHLYHNIKDQHSEVFGTKGLKAQEIAKVVPEMNDKIAEQSQVVYSKVQNSIDKMKKDAYSYPPRLASKIEADLGHYVEAVSKEGSTSAEHFNAIQDLKRQMDSYAEHGRQLLPHEERYDFVKQARNLSNDLRSSLEDKAVWGKAAERQHAINKAFSEFNQPLKEFEKKFTTEINGERVIDRSKIETYLNQAGKTKGELKQGVLKNFIDASEKYHQVIGDTHAGLGLESPLDLGSLHATKSSLNEKTTGARLADIFIDKALSGVGSKGLGAATGAGLGSLAGQPALGALVGAHVFGPFYKSVLPALVKPLLEAANSALGIKGAVDYALAVAKGQARLLKAARAVFVPTKSIGGAAHMQLASENKRMKLDKQLKELQENPEKMYEQAGESNVAHYLPQHAQSLSATSAQAVQYLNSLRPSRQPSSPLDSAPVPSKTEKAAYNNALDIANNPMIVLEKVKNGTITPQDLKTLTAVAPSLYQSMSQQLTNEMMDHLSKHRPVPYNTRIGLSLFLGQPMDSTMKPENIISAQPSASAENKRQQSPQTPPNKPLGKGKATLGKAANAAMTSEQAREQRQNKI